jgi:hydrogenase expression/formation protein HypC
MCLGIPGKVVELYETNGLKMGKVDFGGAIREACLEYLPDIQIGDYTIIHVGFGISQVDEQEAMETMEMLREMEMLAGELPELAKPGSGESEIQD